MDLEEIAELCKQAALRGEMVTIWLPLDWQRPQGVPFVSIKPTKAEADADGTAPWRWRPASLIEYVYTQCKPGADAPQGETK